MSSAAPERWTLTPLSNLGVFSRGRGISKSETVSAGIPCIRYAEIYTDYDICIRSFKSFISPVSAESSKKLNQNDIIFAGSGETVEDIGKSVAFILDCEAYVGGDSIVLSPRSDVDSTFLSYQLNDDIRRKQLRKLGQGSSVIHIYSSGLQEVVVNLPPLPEQKKIASILSSVDEVIENTQKQIDKLQDLKKATMNELLTKGIGHTEFKDSELGRIPKSWEVSFLDDVTKRGSGHTPAKQNPLYWDGGIKWVSLADSGRLDNGFIYETDKEISEQGLENSSAVLHPMGTVVLSRDAGVGKSAVLAEEMAVSQHFMAWRCGNLTDSWFLYYWMQQAKPTFEAIAIGSTIKTIGLDYFKKLKIAHPPLEEQRSIAAKLRSVDKCIEVNRRKRSQTQSLKKSLMQDLLTGKVRVTVNLWHQMSWTR